MRICLLSDGYPPWEHGGAQKIAAQLAIGYAERGHEVSVITTVSDRSDVGRDTVDDATVHRLYAPRLHGALAYLTVHNPVVARACDRALDRADPDVVHAHNVHWLSNASLRAAARRAPVVKTFHDAGTFAYGEFTAVVEETPVGGPAPEEAYRADPRRQVREQGGRYFPLRNRLNRRALDRHVDVGVAVSDALRRALAANGVPCHRTIHNGVRIPDGSTAEGERADGRETEGALAPEAKTASVRRDDRAAGRRDDTASAVDGGMDQTERETALRREYGLGDAPFVLFGGRTSYEKGGEHLAAAFARVCETLDREIHLLVTGNSAYADRMQTVATPYGDRIVTTDWLPRERLRTAFAAARVVATPSVHLDPFPTANLEAFAAGTPVVTTRFGGASELVDDGENGAVVDPRDVDALARALRRSLSDSNCSARRGAAGRRKVAREFTVEAQVEAYLDVLSSAV